MSGYLERKRLALMGASPWWLTSGLKVSDCLAAYQFIGTHNKLESIATNGSYPLTLGSAGAIVEGKGFYIIANNNANADNTDLDAIGAMSTIVHVTGVTKTNSMYGIGLSSAYGGSGAQRGISIGAGASLYNAGGDHYNVSSNNVCVLHPDGNGWYSYTNANPAKLGLATAGVLSVSQTGLYVNETRFQTYDVWDSYRDSYRHCADTVTIGNKWTSGARGTGHVPKGSCYIAAIAFYTVQLTEAQHIALAGNLRARFG